MACLQSLETATGESMAGPYVPMTQPQSELEPPKLKVTKEEMDNAVLVGLFALYSCSCSPVLFFPFLSFSPVLT